MTWPIAIAYLAALALTLDALLHRAADRETSA